MLIVRAGVPRNHDDRSIGGVTDAAWASQLIYGNGHLTWMLPCGNQSLINGWPSDWKRREDVQDPRRPGGHLLKVSNKYDHLMVVQIDQRPGSHRRPYALQ
jgi:hypothetical protein